MDGFWDVSLGMSAIKVAMAGTLEHRCQFPPFFGLLILYHNVAVAAGGPNGLWPLSALQFKVLLNFI